MNRDPKRLLETDDLDPTLRDDLVRAASADPAGYDVGAGLAAFNAALDGTTAGPEPSTAAASAGSSKALTFVVVAVVAAASAGAIAWAVGSRADAPSERVYGAARPTPVQRPAPDAAPDPDTAAGSVRPAEPSDAPPPPDAQTADAPGGVAAADESDAPPEASTQRPPDARTATSPKSPRRAKASSNDDGHASQSDTADRLAAEMKATQAARNALTTDPARALQLARDADAEFAGGLFAQERRAIMVLALFDLGRDEQARQRAEAYLGRHPKGPFADKIRDALARSMK